MADNDANPGTPVKKTLKPWTDHEKVVYLVALLETSAKKLDFDNTPCPPGRTVKACKQMTERLRTAVKSEVQALHDGRPLDPNGNWDSKTPKLPPPPPRATPSKGKAKVDHEETPMTPTKRKPKNDIGDGSPTPKKRRRPKKSPEPLDLDQEQFAGYDTMQEELGMSRKTPGPQTAFGSPQASAAYANAFEEGNQRDDGSPEKRAPPMQAPKNVDPAEQNFNRYMAGLQVAEPQEPELDDDDLIY